DVCSSDLRQIAPETFIDIGNYSAVGTQPDSPSLEERALMALVACPTGSIGTTKNHDVRRGISAFPTLLADNIYYCGFNAESSFGAWSYLVVRPPEEGRNLLVDSPRYVNELANRIEGLGGVRTMLLTHKDDIADHEKYAVG